MQWQAGFLISQAKGQRQITGLDFPAILLCKLISGTVGDKFFVLLGGES